MKQESNKVSPSVVPRLIAALKEILGHIARRGAGGRVESLLIMCSYFLINCNCAALIQDVNYRKKFCFCKNVLYFVLNFSVNLKLRWTVYVARCSGLWG